MVFSLNKTLVPLVFSQNFEILRALEPWGPHTVRPTGLQAGDVVAYREICGGVPSNSSASFTAASAGSLSITIPAHLPAATYQLCKTVVGGRERQIDNLEFRVIPLPTFGPATAPAGVETDIAFASPAARSTEDFDDPRLGDGDVVVLTALDCSTANAVA